METPRFVRVVAGSLSIVYLATNCLFAGRVEGNIWQERRPSSAPNVFIQRPRIPAVHTDLGLRRASMMALARFGTIRNVQKSTHPSPKNPVVLHVQDVHMNSEAQRNISGALQQLIDNEKVRLLALEGAFHSIDLTPFRKFPDRTSVFNVADYMLQEGKISGAIHAAVFAEKTVSTIGIDDFGHYNANVEAVQKSFAASKELKPEILRYVNDLEKKKQQTFDSSLLRFDNTVQQYRNQSLSLGDYASALSRIVDASSSVKTFLKARRLESIIDFSAVARARAEAREKNISPIHFPSLMLYDDYLRAAKSIDSDALANELEHMESAAFKKLSRTPAERELIAQSRRLYLLEKLVNFSLTKNEWDEYENEHRSACAIPHERIQPFEAFYMEAEYRDAAMAMNFLNQINEINDADQSTFVLVTGGFHSSGIDKRLGDAGCTVVTFIPKITKIDTVNGSAYLSVFAQEKFSLDKLFEGEKIFLSPSPMSKSAFGLFAVLVASVALLTNAVSSGIAASWLQSTLAMNDLSIAKAGANAVNIVFGLYGAHLGITFLSGAAGAIRPELSIARQKPDFGRWFPSSIRESLEHFMPWFVPQHIAIRRWPLWIGYAMIVTCGVAFPVLFSEFVSVVPSEVWMWTGGVVAHEFYNRLAKVMGWPMLTRVVLAQDFLTAEQEQSLAREMDSIFDSMLPVLLDNEKAQDLLLRLLKSDLHRRINLNLVIQADVQAHKKGKFWIRPGLTAKNNVRIADLIQVLTRTPSSELYAQIKDWHEKNNDLSLNLRNLTLRFLHGFRELSYSEKQQRQISNWIRTYEDTRNMLVRPYVGIVTGLAKKFTRQGLSIDELESEGYSGLLAAAEHYRVGFGRFSTFATPSVRRSMRVAVLRKAKENAPERTLTESIAGEEIDYDSSKYEELLKQVYQLPRRDQFVLSQYYGLNGLDPEKLEQVGRRLGLSVERIRQIRNRALDRLRERLTSPTGELREEEEGAPISKKLNRQNVIDMLTNVSPSVLMSHEADVLRMIFGINGRVPLTIQEISEATKWSEWQIERIRDAALDKLMKARVHEHAFGRGILPFLARESRFLRLKGHTRSASLIENVVFPSLEELVFSFGAVYVFGAYGLIIARVIHVALHLLGPPLSDRGAQNVFRKLFIPVLISVAPFSFLGVPSLSSSVFSVSAAFDVAAQFFEWHVVFNSLVDLTGATVAKANLPTNDDIVGPYRILREIRPQSARAVAVYEAVHVETNAKVILKTYLDFPTNSQEFLNAHSREVRNLWLLTQKGINFVPKLIDQGVDYHGAVPRYWFAMELVEGKTLDKWLAANASYHDRLQVFRNLLVVVDRFHREGYVHLDLTATNIMVLPDNQVMLIDVELMQSLEVSLQQFVLGAPAYASPETRAGFRGVYTRSADVFSLGVILFLMSTGMSKLERHPANDGVFSSLVTRYPDADIYEWVRAEIAKQSPWAVYGDVISKALRANPHSRFTSARNFLKAMDDAAVHHALDVSKAMQAIDRAFYLEDTKVVDVTTAPNDLMIYTVEPEWKTGLALLTQELSSPHPRFQLVMRNSRLIGIVPTETRRDSSFRYLSLADYQYDPPDYSIGLSNKWKEILKQSSEDEARLEEYLRSRGRTDREIQGGRLNGFGDHCVEPAVLVDLGTSITLTSIRSPLEHPQPLLASRRQAENFVIQVLPTVSSPIGKQNGGYEKAAEDRKYYFNVTNVAETYDKKNGPGSWKGKKRIRVVGCGTGCDAVAVLVGAINYHGHSIADLRDYIRINERVPEWAPIIDASDINPVAVENTKLTFDQLGISAVVYAHVTDNLLSSIPTTELADVIIWNMPSYPADKLADQLADYADGGANGKIALDILTERLSANLADGGVGIFGNYQTPVILDGTQRDLVRYKLVNSAGARERGMTVQGGGLYGSREVYVTHVPLTQSPVTRMDVGLKFRLEHNQQNNELPKIPVRHEDWIERRAILGGA